MAFPPRFLDEVRARVSLAEVVGRRVKLIRRGREYIGLCPFHNEKTPSFSAVEDKGFFHCFGCGAHGDVIGFVMQSESLSFPEAVAQLAQLAGLEVPRETPAEREKSERQATLQEAVAAAGAFFEQRLHAPDGRVGLQYLENRGLDPNTIRRFHLGYAPESRDALKRALTPRFPEALLVEAGLLRRPEGGGETYDYFRHRVIFPIGDRRDSPIAFGGRVLGDGQPKYLNSPETPLFQKGRTLYALAPARAAAARKPSAIVVEGYMDVIALHRAGFDTAVAPLGTALTEAQLDLLWRLAPEPVLCFDGDGAGQRAATRALDRALPLLGPGRSLRFATLPPGEDPDTFVSHHGAPAMSELLDRAPGLAELLWRLETAQPADTPERRAALEQRLEERARSIADRSVQEHYRAFFRERMFATFRGRPAPSGRGRERSGPRRPARGGRFGGRPGEGGPPGWGEAAPTGDPALLRRRREEVLLALLINHPFLLGEIEEDLTHLELAGRDLDRLCGEILKAHQQQPDLDGEMLKRHLTKHGFAGTVATVLSDQVLNHAAFARSDADPDSVRRGWGHTKDQFQQRRLATQIKDAERDLAEDMTPEKWARLQQTLLERKDEDDGVEDSGAVRESPARD